MPNVRYHTGDTIVLKARTRGSVQPKGTGQILAVLPITYGLARYRVRLNGENFDRNIDEDDIDTEASTARVIEVNRASAHQKAGSSWIDLSALKTRK
ncbi:cold-shock protein [Agrobacterium sp. NPDC090273]|uniref:cold-shock protein n=1 Tax=Agrobacterium TaxID=357 RepID=UPI0021D3401E|nr:cold-shock protein [Agrobacterium tumefaciens]UXS00773.1 cold-shock protein [Agrobacterium tumefaciens]